MGNLIQDESGKICAAKVAFMISLAVCLVKIIISGLTIGNIKMEVVDYSGMAMFLTPLATLYWGRNHTKANK